MSQVRALVREPSPHSSGIGIPLAQFRWLGWRNDGFTARRSSRWCAIATEGAEQLGQRADDLRPLARLTAAERDQADHHHDERGYDGNQGNARPDG